MCKVTIRNLLWGGIFLLTLSLSAQAQQQYNLNLTTGEVKVVENLGDFIADPGIQPNELIGGKYHRIVQFHQVPTQEQQEAMRMAGLDLQHYLPNNAYYTAIPAGFNPNLLVQFGVRSVITVDPEWKLDLALASAPYPGWTVEGDFLKVAVSWYDGLAFAEVKARLEQYAISFDYTSPTYPYAGITIPMNKLNALVAEPAVRWVEPVSPPDVPDDLRGRSLHRSNVLDSQSPLGRRYDGSGVTVCVRDDGDVGPHIDFQGRLDQTYASATAGTHGDGVAGVFGAAGNLDPTYKGMAPGAFFYILDYDATFLDVTLSLHLNNEMMITNSSYSNGCNAGYTTIAETVDRQLHQNPSLMHVFSAGNSNNNNCGYGAGNQWGNITGGHKQGKNCITTANVFEDDQIVGSSSRGPAYDGRIKPDIAAHGQGQGSTFPNNTYGGFGGTSAAAPCIAGVTAQLYHAYKDLNSGVNPPAALIKACLLNGADDLGNVGPDFIFGWGRVNALNSVVILENNQFINASVTQGNTNLHNITVPAGVAQVRVMTYWADPEAPANAATALINNLDVTLTDPSTTVNFPWILDPTPNAATLALPATTGVDNLNNMEQVSLNNPVAGNYTLSVAGTSVPQGPQEYWVVYSFIYDQITVTYPMGGESFVPTESEFIRWDAFGNTGTFTLEYSINNGATWNTIATGIAGNRRYYDWTVPNVGTGEALIRVSRGAVSDQSDVVFNIYNLPTGLAVNDLCTGGATVSWNAVAGATDYDVFMLGNEYMDSIGTTTATSFDVFGLTSGNTYWFSVRARTATATGRRANAVSHTQAGAGICPIPDLTITAVVSPVDIPRSCVATGFSNSETVEITVDNIGNTDLGNITLNYQLNGGPVTSEIYGPQIVSGNNVNFAFTVTVDMSSGNQHDLRVWLEQPGDANEANDTLETTLTAFPNAPVTLPFIEDFESAPVYVTQVNELGVAGLLEWDYQTSIQNRGRLRTGLSGFAQSGQRAVTMDASPTGTHTENYLELNLNMTNYTTAQKVMMDFSWMEHGDEGHAEDRVWIRGSSSDPWVQVYDWDANSPGNGQWTRVDGLDLSAALAGAGQTFGCDFQVRFSQRDNFSANSITADDGFTVDDVQIYELQLVNTFPYLEDFESGTGGWISSGLSDSWAYGTPTGTHIGGAASGSNAFVTNLGGLHNNQETSYLYSPCFDLSSFATDPFFSFSFIYELENNFDYGWVEYSEDGQNWTRLGLTGGGFNWYNVAGNQWNGEATRNEWRMASYVIPVSTMGVTTGVRFRFAMNSDQLVGFEGLGIDDIHIHDDVDVYGGATVTGLSQAVSGTGWTEFYQGGDLVFAINPNGQNLGTTTVDAHIWGGPVRNFANMYYGDRSWVVNTQNAPASPVTVRAYYLDTEIWNLYTATGCGPCTGIPDLYTFGVSKYDGVNEDGDLPNSTDPGFIYIPETNITVVPWKNGYYYEFQVDNFSELWINHGQELGAPFPIEMASFTVEKRGQHARLAWETASELQNRGFYVEHSMSPFTQGEGETLGFVEGAGNSTTSRNYSFMHLNLGPGQHFYRLRQVDLDGNFSYSEVRSLNVGGGAAVSVFPNPFSDDVTLQISSAKADDALIRVSDVAGRQVRTQAVSLAQGYNEVSLLIGAQEPAGMYFVTVLIAGERFVLKVQKQ